MLEARASIPRFWTAAFLLAAVIVVAAVVFNTSDAHADPDDCWVEDPENPGELDYICEEEEDDQDPGSGDGGGSSEPTCDLSIVEEKGIHDGAQRWCEGENTCWANIPATAHDEDDVAEQRPSPDHVVIYKQCFGPNGEEFPPIVQWYLPPEPPSLQELAEQAYGQLNTPGFTLEFNPPSRSYVSLATWWWVQGPGNDEIVGSSALGLVAVGVPSRIEVDPGDGTGAVGCPWSAAKSDTCTHTYTRASVSGTATGPAGSPAYLARARLIYEVHFEQDGAPIDVPGLPDEFASFESPWQSTPVPVAEIQSIVTE